MYANLFKYFFRKLTIWERKGNWVNIWFMMGYGADGIIRPHIRSDHI